MAKILIIDDDALVRDALGVFLSKEGHDVLTAADGADGLLTFKSAAPDLVILDRGLPLMPGTVVLAKIRVISKTVPVVMLTGHDAPEDAEACLAAGATRAFSKADGLAAVLAEIEGLVGKPPPCAKPPDAQGAWPAARYGTHGRGLVLVADDDAAILHVLGRFLAEAGYCVITASDGLEAERLAHESRPDIILLDIFMPGKDGLELLKLFSAEMPGTGVMMITGNEDEEVARACLNLGAFDYAAKPLNLEALGESIKARLLLQKAKGRK